MLRLLIAGDQASRQSSLGGYSSSPQPAAHGSWLIATTLVLIPSALAPGARNSIACDAFSWVSVTLAAAVALYGLGALAIERWLTQQGRSDRVAQRTGPMPTRLLLAIPLSLLLLGLLFALIPQCASGPYAGIAKPAAQLVERVSEAQPLLKALRERPATAGSFIVSAGANTARKAIARHGVDLLLVCPHDPVATHERRDDIRLFYDQLRAGETPAWLAEIPHPGTARQLAPQHRDQP